MPLDYDGANNGLFTHIGAAVKHYNLQRTDGRDLDADALYVLEKLQAGDKDLIVSGLPGQVEGWKGQHVGRRQQLVDLVTARLQHREDVLEEIGAVSTEIQEILLKLHRTMIIDAETINRSTVTISAVTAVAGNTGNGTLLTTALLDGLSSPGSGPAGQYLPCQDYKGQVSELAFTAEDFLLICQTDAATDGAADGTETFLWTGNPPHVLHGLETNQGSGTIASVQSGQAAGLLQNLDFETFTVANTPDSWTIVSGAVATNILSEAGAGNFYHGTKSLRLKGGTTVKITQAPTGLGNSVRGNRMYCVTARLKSALAAGTILIQFEGTGYTAGAAEKIDLAFGALTGSWELQHFFVLMPDILPADLVLAISLTGAAAGDWIYLDDLSFSPVTYGAGIGIVLVRGDVPFVREDRFTFDVANDDAGVFQAFMRDAYGFQFPSDAAPTIADALGT